MLITFFGICNLSNFTVTISERVKVADHVAHKSRAKTLYKFQ
jgi:hypothetical protein